MAKRVDEKCKNCEHLIVTETSKNHNSGKGVCYRIKVNLYEKYKRKLAGLPENDPKERCFSSPICKHYDRRKSTREVGEGTK